MLSLLLFSFAFLDVGYSDDSWDAESAQEYMDDMAEYIDNINEMYNPDYEGLDYNTGDDYPIEVGIDYDYGSTSETISFDEDGGVEDAGVITYIDGAYTWDVVLPENFEKVEISHYDKNNPDVVKKYMGWNAYLMVNNQMVWQFLSWDSSSGGQIFDYSLNEQVSESSGSGKWIDATDFFISGSNTVMFYHYSEGDGIGLNINVETEEVEEEIAEELVEIEEEVVVEPVEEEIVELVEVEEVVVEPVEVGVVEEEPIEKVTFFGHEEAASVKGEIVLEGDWKDAVVEGPNWGDKVNVDFDKATVLEVEDEELKFLVTEFKKSKEDMGLGGAAWAMVDVGVSLIGGTIAKGGGYIGKAAGLISTVDDVANAVEGASVAVEESEKSNIPKGVVKGGAAIVPGGNYAYNAISGLDSQSEIQNIVGGMEGWAKVVVGDVDGNGVEEVIAYTRTGVYILEVNE